VTPVAPVAPVSSGSGRESINVPATSNVGPTALEPTRPNVDVPATAYDLYVSPELIVLPTEPTVVEEPFYKQVWFWGVVAGLLVAGVGVYYYFRKKKSQ